MTRGLRTMRIGLVVAWSAMACAAGCSDSSGGDAAASGGAAAEGAAGSATSGTAGTPSGSTAGTTAGGAAAADAPSAGMPAAAGSDAAGMDVQTGGNAAAGTGGAAGTDVPPTSASASFEQVSGWIADYKAAHPGNGGKDWDIAAKTPAELAADSDAQRLHDLCGADQVPVIPQLAWEYGGGDHQWIDPDAAPLVMCVYTPVNPNTDHWAYDSSADNVTADVYVLYPDDNPCKDQQGADRIAACIGDPTNFEILVDTASFDDGHAVGLELSEASTDLFVVAADGSKVLLVHNN